MSILEQEISRPAISRQTQRWLSGFLLLGMLPGLLGPLLILWYSYLEIDPRTLGLHALALNIGALTGLFIERRCQRSLGVSACVLCAAALLSLPFAGPPVPLAFRCIALFALGLAVGALSSQLGGAVGPSLHAAPARVANICGAYFGAGALFATAVLGGTYAAGQRDFGAAILSIIPLSYLLLTRDFPEPSTAPPERHQNIRPIATSLLSILLFVQIGNEWVLAVWLPFFLIHNLGASPTVAIALLGIHFVFLLFGRWLAKALLPIVSHSRFLLAGITLSLGGYVILATGHTLPSATTAVILVGLALGPVFPIAAESLDRDLSNGSVGRILVALASGALFEPYLTGFVCADFGVRDMMFVPAIGSVAVCVIALLMMLESHLMVGAKIAT